MWGSFLYHEYLTIYSIKYKPAIFKSNINVTAQLIPNIMPLFHINYKVLTSVIYILNNYMHLMLYLLSRSDIVRWVKDWNNKICIMALLKF